MLGANLRQLCPTLCDPWAVAHQVPLFMGSSRQDYWSRLPCPPVGCLPDPEIRPMSLTSPALAGGFFTTEPSRKAIYLSNYYISIERKISQSPLEHYSEVSGSKHVYSHIPNSELLPLQYGLS